MGDIPVIVGPAKTGVADQTNQHFTVSDCRRQTPKFGSQIKFIFLNHNFFFYFARSRTVLKIAIEC